MVRLREELDREREERNYFQLERDKVNTFWEITKRQLEERKAEIRNKDREMEDAEERHQVEIKVRLLKYKQNIWAYHLFFKDVWKGISDNWESREIFIHHVIMLKLFQVYKQKVKHLLFEHQNNISDLKADNVCALKLAQEDHREEEKKLRKDKRGLKVTLKEEELSHEDIIKNLKKVRQQLHVTL